MNPKLKDKLISLPDKPGVYLMKNSHKKIIYVGKAKNLKKRVRSYFSGEKDIKTKVLVQNIQDIETIVTTNEKEAILLENNLIKQWKPRYNINLKDGKTYPVIRITAEKYPRIFRTRRILFDGSVYYGPYPNINQLEIYLKIIEELYPLRKCKDRNQPKQRNSPCLYYHIHRCKGPCCNYYSQEEYQQDVERIKKLLSGNIKELCTEIEAKMLQASQDLDFEKAAVYRDRLEAIKQFSGVERIVDFRQENRDYIGQATEENLASFIVLQMRGGKLSGREVFRTEIHTEPSEALREFISQYYAKVNKVPPYIFLPLKPDTESLDYLFREILKRKTCFRIPQRGKHLKLIKMANENAQEDIKERSFSEKDKKAMHGLQEALGLPHIPHRIEGFDISHLAGKHMVGAMVTFLNGKPEKKSYRYFHIKSLPEGQIDDFEAMREVIARRYTKIINEEMEKPDLILIDGGKGQLNAAFEILQALSLGEIPIIGLAKKREEIFKTGRPAPLVLDKTNPALGLLQAVRDESHRFGIRLNRRLARNELVFSILENIHGIGKKKSKELIVKYGSLQNLLQDTPQNIARTAGISLQVATELIDFLTRDVTRET